MTYGQLPKQPKPGVTLFCPECQEHFSAYRGDYFLRQPDLHITCDNRHPTLKRRDGTPILCGASMYLVLRQHAPQRVIAPADAEAQP